MLNADKKLTDHGNKPAAQASLQLLPLIMDNIPQAVFWKDRNLVYLGCNRAFAEDAGFSSPEEVIGKTDFDMPWKEQAELYRADDQHVMDCGEPKLNYEEPQTTPDGSTIWLSTSKIPVQEKGQIVAVLGMYEDVTVRKQAQQAVLDSEDRFRQFTELTNEGLVFHERGKIIDANPAAIVLFGLSEEKDFIGKNLLDFVVPDSQPLVIEKMQLENVAPYEVQCLRKDGAIFPAETSTRTYKRGERLIRATSIRDISVRKRAESLQEQNEHLFQSLFDLSPDAVMLIDPYDPSDLWPVIDCNAAACRMSGYQRSELIGQSIDILNADENSQADRKDYLKQIREKSSLKYETTHRHKDGTVFPIEVSTSLIKIGDRELLIGIDRDITERKQAEADLLLRDRALTSSINAVLIAGLDFKPIYVNETFLKMTGYTYEEAMRINVMDLSGNPEGLKRIDEATHSQGFFVGEEPVKRKDGSIFPTDFSTSYITDIKGKPIAIQTTFIDITERKQAEQDLRESQQFLQTVMDNIPQSIFWKDSNLTYLGCNSAFAADAALASPAEAVGKTDWDMPWKEQAELYRADDSLVMKNGTPKLNYEEPQTNPQSQTTWLRTSKIPLYDNAGKVFAVLGMYEDITERKKMEEALSESQDRFRRFAEATTEGMVFHDLGTVIDVNLATVSMFGFSEPAELINRNLLEFIVPESHQMVLEKMQSGTVLPYEIQCIRKDGSLFPVETSTRAYKMGGREIRASSLRDITERRQAERALRESQQFLQTVMDNIPQSIFWKDNNLTYLGCNSAFATDTGFTSPSEIIGKTDWDMPWKDQADAYRADDSLVIKSGVPKLNYEEPQTTPDGRTSWLRTSKIPLYDMDGKTFAVLGMYEDITERKQLELQIQEAFERRGLQVQLSTQVSQSIASASSLDELYERVVTQIKDRFGYYHTQLLRYDPVQEAVVLVTGYGEVGAKMLAAGHRMPMGEGLIGTAAATGETLLRPNLANDPDWHPNPLLPETKGEIAVPIKLGDTVLGVLDVQSNTAGALDADDQLLLEGLCGQVATAIEDTRLRQEMTERLEEVNRLYRAMSHEGWQTYQQNTDIPTGFIYDQAGVRPVQDPALAQEHFANIPLTVPGGEVIGKLAIADDPQRPLSAEEEAFLLQVSEQLALALESARLFEQTQTALVSVQESQAALDEAMNVAGMANWQLSFETFKFTFNDRLYQMLGTTAEEEGGYEISAEEYIKNFIHPEDALLVAGAIQTGLQSPDPQSFKGTLEYRMIRKRDGQIRYMLTDYRLIANEQKKAIGGVGTFLDITERKLAELTVAKRAEELKTVATVSTTASTVLNPDQLLQAVVDLAKERFNLYHAHIYTYDESWSTLLLAAGAGEVGRKLVAEEHAIPLSIENSLVARAARERKAVTVNDVNNEPDFLPNPLLPETRAEMAVPMTVGDKLLGVFDVQSSNPAGFSDEDANIYVTLAAQIGVALQNARQYMEQAALVTQLRELDRLKSSFLANMSHELRTPLNSILGFADVIIEELDGPLTENMSNDLRLIQKNGQHLLHLINDVLDMAKIEAGRMNLSPETFKAYEVLEEVTSITSTLASEKNLALFIEESSDREVNVYADRTRLRQVMINLVNNAIKFTENGKIAIKVASLEGARILITVKDTGIGIPPDKLEAVFQEFTQVDSSTTRKAGGTGLGLPISRRLVEMHGGRLWAESTGIYGEGSTFLVELPVEARITETVEKKVK